MFDQVVKRAVQVGAVVAVAGYIYALGVVIRVVRNEVRISDLKLGRVRAETLARRAEKAA